MDSGSITDRGLSNKRPHNEDSFLEMTACGIYAVADGVGGAQGGDVASQMAVEILGEAFANRGDGVDAEDVLREAIQRANAAIYQMALELPQLSGMATTLVALHLNENIATIGHVGDSRLYRVDREGDLHRDTEDHSMVADEVRAGRMTEEQAENHPGRNIISRALGAEPMVEPDLKTIYVEPGTAFLLCSDGITRHITDDEIKGVLTFGGEPPDICEYLKGLCYERGAEDNLTAVVVKVRGESAGADLHETMPMAQREADPHETVPMEQTEADLHETVPLMQAADEEDTIITARSPLEEPLDDNEGDDLLELDTGDLSHPQRRSEPEPPASYVAATDHFEAPFIAEEESTAEPSYEEHQASPLPSFAADEPAADGSLKKMAASVALLLLGALVGLGAYHMFLRPQAQPVLPLSTMSTNNIPLSAFEENRRNVDNDPANWVARYSGSAQDCEDHYLLARAFLLLGDQLKARTEFIAARDKLPSVDAANRKVLSDEIAMGMALTSGTTIGKLFKDELRDANNIAGSGNSNAAH